MGCRMGITELLKDATIKVIGYPLGGILILAGVFTFVSPNAGIGSKVVAAIVAIIGVALWLAASRS